MSIKNRMVLVLAASVVITLGAILGMSYLLQVSSTSARNLAATARTKSEALFQLLDLVTKVQAGTQKLAQENDPDVMESLIAQNDSLVKLARDKIQEVAANESSVQSSFADLLRANEEVKNLLMQGRNAESHQAIIEKSNPAFEALLNAITQYQGKTGQLLDDQAGQVRARTSHLQSAIFALVAVTVLLLIGSGLVLVRGVTTGLHSVILMVQDIAQGEGDLTKRLKAESHDELGQLAHWFNLFMDKLQNVLRQVASEAEQLASSSQQLSGTAARQAEGAEKQREQTQHVATAMHEMAETVLQVSENSNKAAGASSQAAETARRGGKIVEDTLARMRQLSSPWAGQRVKCRSWEKDRIRSDKSSE